jgi:hypothetical protein
MSHFRKTVRSLTEVSLYSKPHKSIARVLGWDEVCKFCHLLATSREFCFAHFTLPSPCCHYNLFRQDVSACYAVCKYWVGALYSKRHWRMAFLWRYSVCGAIWSCRKFLLPDFVVCMPTSSVVEAACVTDFLVALPQWSCSKGSCWSSIYV